MAGQSKVRVRVQDHLNVLRDCPGRGLRNAGVEA